MKRILVLLTAIAFAASFSTTTVAVEKKEKKAEDKKQQTTNTKNQKKSPPSSDIKKKYDDFVDHNKNCIDDRCENLKPKSAPTMAPVAKKTEKKPTVPPAKVETKKGDSSGKKPK